VIGLRVSTSAAKGCLELHQPRPDSGEGGFKLGPVLRDQALSHGETPIKFSREIAILVPLDEPAGQTLVDELRRKLGQETQAVGRRRGKEVEVHEQKANELSDGRCVRSASPGETLRLDLQQALPNAFMQGLEDRPEISLHGANLRCIRIPAHPRKGGLVEGRPRAPEIGYFPG
jgi:hypothetical protein